MSKTWRLCHVHIFLQIAMEKGIFDIKLFKLPIICRCKSKYKSNCSWFNYRAESVLKVKSFNLRVSLCYQMSFMSFNCPIFFVFYFEDPFGAYNVGITRRRNKLSCLVFLKCIQLLLHYLGPSEIFESLFMIAWFST